MMTALLLATAIAVGAMIGVAIVSIAVMQAIGRAIMR